MIEPKAMSHDIEVSDPLSWAIGEFREELLLWIDIELVRLREREQAEDLMREEEPAAASGSQFSTSSSRLGASRVSPYFQPGMTREEPRTRQRLADRDSVVETARPPVVLPELQTDPEPRTPLANPRQRLDALARLLDHRLKQAQGAAETSRGAGKGPNTGVEDDTPQPSRLEDRR
jgi:hypothetical protein